MPKFMPTEIRAVLERTYLLEVRLEEDFGAQGVGLAKKVASVSDQLPLDLYARIDTIADARAQLVDVGELPNDLPGFMVKIDEALASLVTLRRAATGSALDAFEPSLANRSAQAV